MSNHKNSTNNYNYNSTLNINNDYDDNNYEINENELKEVEKKLESFDNLENFKEMSSEDFKNILNNDSYYKNIIGDDNNSPLNYKDDIDEKLLNYEIEEKNYFLNSKEGKDKKKSESRYSKISLLNDDYLLRDDIDLDELDDKLKKKRDSLLSIRNLRNSSIFNLSVTDENIRNSLHNYDYYNNDKLNISLSKTDNAYDSDLITPSPSKGKSKLNEENYEINVHSDNINKQEQERQRKRSIDLLDEELDNLKKKYLLSDDYNNDNEHILDEYASDSEFLKRSNLNKKISIDKNYGNDDSLNNCRRNSNNSFSLWESKINSTRKIKINNETPKKGILKQSNSISPIKMINENISTRKKSVQFSHRSVALFDEKEKISPLHLTQFTRISSDSNKSELKKKSQSNTYNASKDVNSHNDFINNVENSPIDKLLYKSNDNNKRVSSESMRFQTKKSIDNIESARLSPIKNELEPTDFSLRHDNDLDKLLSNEIDNINEDYIKNNLDNEPNELNDFDHISNKETNKLSDDNLKNVEKNDEYSTKELPSKINYVNKLLEKRISTNKNKNFNNNVEYNERKSTHSRGNIASPQVNMNNYENKIVNKIENEQSNKENYLDSYKNEKKQINYDELINKNEEIKKSLMDNSNKFKNNDALSDNKKKSYKKSIVETEEDLIYGSSNFKANKNIKFSNNNKFSNEQCNIKGNLDDKKNNNINNSSFKKENNLYNKGDVSNFKKFFDNKNKLDRKTINFIDNNTKNNRELNSRDIKSKIVNRRASYSVAIRNNTQTNFKSTNSTSGDLKNKKLSNEKKDLSYQSNSREKSQVGFRNRLSVQASLKISNKHISSKNEIENTQEKEQNETINREKYEIENHENERKSNKFIQNNDKEISNKREILNKKDDNYCVISENEKRNVQKENYEDEVLSDQLYHEKYKISKAEENLYEQENCEKENYEQENYEKENFEKENYEQENCEKEDFENENYEQENYEENFEKENYEQENVEQENYEQENVEQENYEQENFEKENFEKENYEQENYEQENYEQENYEQENFEKENYEENYEQENFEKENYEQENYEENYEQENFEKENYEQENVEQENYEQENYEQENFEKENYEQENYEQENYEQENYEQENFEKENYEQENYENKYERDLIRKENKELYQTNFKSRKTYLDQHMNSQKLNENSDEYYDKMDLNTNEENYKKFVYDNKNYREYAMNKDKINRKRKQNNVNSTNLYYDEISEKKDYAYEQNEELNIYEEITNNKNLNYSEYSRNKKGDYIEIDEDEKYIYENKEKEKSKNIIENKEHNIDDDGEQGELEEKEGDENQEKEKDEDKEGKGDRENEKENKRIEPNNEEYENEKLHEENALYKSISKNKNFTEEKESKEIKNKKKEENLKLKEKLNENLIKKQQTIKAITLKVIRRCRIYSIKQVNNEGKSMNNLIKLYENIRNMIFKFINKINNLNNVNVKLDDAILKYEITQLNYSKTKKAIETLKKYNLKIENKINEKKMLLEKQNGVLNKKKKKIELLTNELNNLKNIYDNGSVRKQEINLIKIYKEKIEELKNIEITKGFLIKNINKYGINFELLNFSYYNFSTLYDYKNLDTFFSKEDNISENNNTVTNVEDSDKKNEKYNSNEASMLIEQIDFNKKGNFLKEISNLYSNEENHDNEKRTALIKNNMLSLNDDANIKISDINELYKKEFKSKIHRGTKRKTFLKNQISEEDLNCEWPYNITVDIIFSNIYKQKQEMDNFNISSPLKIKNMKHLIANKMHLLNNENEDNKKYLSLFRPYKILIDSFKNFKDIKISTYYKYINNENMYYHIWNKNYDKDKYIIQINNINLNNKNKKRKSTNLLIKNIESYSYYCHDNYLGVEWKLQLEIVKYKLLEVINKKLQKYTNKEGKNNNNNNNNIINNNDISTAKPNKEALKYLIEEVEYSFFILNHILFQYKQLLKCFLYLSNTYFEYYQNIVIFKTIVLSNQISNHSFWLYLYINLEESFTFASLLHGIVEVKIECVDEEDKYNEECKSINNNIMKKLQQCIFTLKSRPLDISERINSFNIVDIIYAIFINENYNFNSYQNNVEENLKKLKSCENFINEIIDKRIVVPIEIKNSINKFGDDQNLKIF